MLSHIRSCLQLLLFTSLLIALSDASEESNWEDCTLDLTPDEHMYCSLNCQPTSSDGLSQEPVDANCGAWGTPPFPKVLWAKLSTLRSVFNLEIKLRAERVLKVFPSPLVFSEMRNLTYFTLKSAKIEKLNRFAFGNSTSLSDILIEDNGFKELEVLSISHLSNVSRITLGKNELKEINRHVFVDLPLLKCLYLDRNGIQIIHDKAFVELKGLEELDLQKNNLSTLVKEVFSGLGRLKQLELQDNQIEYLGPQVFSEMPLLRDLDLHNNQIRSIHPTALFNLKHLARLNLKRNKIVSIEPPTFSQMGNIYFLDLRHNELEALTEEAVEPIYTNFQQSTMELMLEGNRMTCGCHILWMRKLFTETNNENMRIQLGKVQCNMFQNSGEREHRHVYNASHVRLEAVSPDEATTFAFDGTKNVTQLNPSEFKCSHKSTEDELKTLHPQSDEDGLNKRHPQSDEDELKRLPQSDEEEPKKRPSKPDLRHSLHESHIDTTGRSSDLVSGSLIFTIGLSFLLLLKANPSFVG